MTLDANKYRINIKSIAHQLDAKTQQERYDYIGPLALSSGVPIIIICYYIAELYGMTDNIKTFILRLKEFYSITEVFGVEL